MTGRSDSVPMSEPVRDLLGAFDRMAEPDQREFVSEILRRTKDLELPPLDEETINRIADESFLEYDIREAADARYSRYDQPKRDAIRSSDLQAVPSSRRI